MTVLLYHDPPPATFETHVRFLQEAYNIISLRAFLDSWKLDALHQLPPRALVITLDDGHKGNFALKPVLERLRTPVTIFVCTGVIGTYRQFWFAHVTDPLDFRNLPDSDRIALLAARGFDERAEVAEREALSSSEIQEMRTLVDFQPHTVFHPFLPRCSRDKAQQEIIDSRRHLEEDFGIDVYAFAYPNGDYSAREVALVKDACYECALSVDSGFNSARSDPFRLKRIAIDEADGIDELALKACGAWGIAKLVLATISLKKG